MAKKINFTWGGRYTQYYSGLLGASRDGGLKVNDLARGPRYIGAATIIMENLRGAGFVELRYSGPRNGKRYHITKNGQEKLEEIRPHG